MSLIVSSQFGEKRTQFLIRAKGLWKKKIPMFATGRFTRKEDNFGTIHAKQSRASKQKTQSSLHPQSF